MKLKRIEKDKKCIINFLKFKKILQFYNIIIK